MIIATAGHVDHGKTSLIRQLTGVETDRLAEEQRRGLSISLGYAYLPREGGAPLGFIDVPGHQRFINNMISGISGIDMGMLIVASDDGPMPQTVEHLDVLQLLGVRQLVVVISKIDRVAPARLDQVKQEILAILSPRPWTNPAFFPISSVDGAGVANLKSHLLECAAEAPARSATGYFRLSIDRAFTARGAGLIVTGTASAGRISVGESLCLLPRGVELRVRGLHVHDQPAETAAAGQRCALNVAGKLNAEAIARGDWLVQPGAGPASSRVDVQFSLLESAPFTLKNLSPVKMHIGAKRVPARIALLPTPGQANRLAPGGSCLAQLILAAEVACFSGERFLLRDHAENVTLGGGTIIDPRGPRSGKSRPERIEYLNAMHARNPADALAGLIALNRLVDLDRFRQAWNLREDEATDLSRPEAHCFTADGAAWMISASGWARADTALLAYLDGWHVENPEMSGIKATDLKSALAEHCESALLTAILTSRLRDGDLALADGRISRAGFQPAVSVEAAAHWRALRQVLEQCGSHVPLLSEACAQTGIDVKTLEQIAKDAVKKGRLHDLNSKRYALPAILHRYAGEIIVMANAGEALTVAAIKIRFGTGRNLTVEILEYFDRVRFTLRQGNVRKILDPDLPARLFRG